MLYIWFIILLLVGWDLDVVLWFSCLLLDWDWLFEFCLVWFWEVVWKCFLVFDWGIGNLFFGMLLVVLIDRCCDSEIDGVFLRGL